MLFSCWTLSETRRYAVPTFLPAVVLFQADLTDFSSVLMFCVCRGVQPVKDTCSRFRIRQQHGLQGPLPKTERL